MRVTWTARRSNQTVLKDIGFEYSLEGLMLQLKLQYFCHLMGRVDFTGTDPDIGKDYRREEKGMTADGMVGCYHQLNEHEFEKTPGDGEGQESLVCCSPWGCKNNNNKKYAYALESSSENMHPAGFIQGRMETFDINFTYIS